MMHGHTHLKPLLYSSYGLLAISLNVKYSTGYCGVIWYKLKLAISLNVKYSTGYCGVIWYKLKLAISLNVKYSTGYCGVRYGTN